MNNLLEKVLHLKSRVTLGGERKRAIKEQLVENLGIDVSADDLARHYQGKPRLASVVMSYLNSMPITAIVGIILALSAGVSFASEGSLPGDVLYSIKTGINEEVRGAFTFGTASDARWDARVAERRLEEAAKLSAEGTVKAETRAKLEADFKGASNRAQRRIEKLHTEGKVQAAAEITGELAAMLHAHETALIKIEGKGTSERERVNTLRREVQEELQETAEVKVFLDTQAAVEGGTASPSPTASPTRTTTPKPSPTPKPIIRLDGSTNIQLR